MPGNRPYRDWKQMPVIPLTNASCISCGLCAARCPVQAIL
ncbi:MAG: 4Fe-4S binding protein [Clostridium sp.]